MDKIKSLVINKYTLGIVLLVLAFAAGRYLAPTKVVEKEKIVERETKEKETKKDKTKKTRKHKVIIKVTKPDGTIEERIEEFEDEDSVVSIDTREKSTKDKETEKTKITETSKPQWRVAGLVGADLSKSSFKSLSIGEYGASAERRILGPIHGGIWATSRPVVGVSLGIEF